MGHTSYRASHIKTRTRQRKPALTIVIPVMNEAENIEPLVRRVRAALKKTKTEVLFVDDSLDTDSVVAAERAQYLFGGSNLEIHIMHREDKKRHGGLSGAVTDGMRAAKGRRIVVMDGDLQHPPETIPAMLKASRGKDIVVASRYCQGGSADGLDGGIRHLVSHGSTLLAKIVFPLRLRRVSDPMTGFFLLNYRKVKRRRLRPQGFKILLEILATHPEFRKAEVPLQFAERNAGESHGDMKQGLIFLGQLLGLRFGFLLRRYARLPKTVQFGFIGGMVFVIGMIVLFALVELAGMPPLVANAIQLALTFWLNYILNRRITWRERNVQRRAAYKFLISRSATTILNYALFAWLISVALTLSLFGHSLRFHVNYMVANVITLAVVMALNYVATDRWAFAEAKSKQSPPPRPPRPNLGLPAHDTERRATGLGTTSAVIAMACGLILGVMWWAPVIALPTVMAFTSVALFVQASLEAWRMLYTYREPESVDRLRFPAAVSDAAEKFCLIVPARHESETLAHTLHLLARQTYPNVVIYCVICDDDTDTLAVAQSVANQEDRVQVVTYPLDPETKPSKPLQLNYVFERIRREGFTIVAVFDAEDTVHPELLAHVAGAFRDPQLDIVQGGVQLMNHDSSWYALHNVLEYYRWFNSAMAYNADQEFMPLGGNTIFIRFDMLQQAGGWPNTLTEDCSLGVLLSTRFRAKTAVFYEPLLATQEETPNSLIGLFKQRVRWNQGFFHEWRKGVWLGLPTFRQRVLACYVLLSSLMLATIGVFMVVSLAAIVLLRAPVIMAMLMYLPFIPIGLLAVLNMVFLYDFGKAFHRKVTVRQYTVLILTQLVYQIVLNVAALWAVIRELRGITEWHKTPHSGLHRLNAGDIIGAMPPALASERAIE